MPSTWHQAEQIVGRIHQTGFPYWSAATVASIASTTGRPPIAAGVMSPGLCRPAGRVRVE